jgi:hypothetical protein
MLTPTAILILVALMGFFVVLYINPLGELPANRGDFGCLLCVFGLLGLLDVGIDMLSGIYEFFQFVD